MARKKKARRQRTPNKQPKTVSKDLLNDAAKRILAAIRRIPRGRVSTYGDIAEVAGLPRRARLVGAVLRETPASSGVPWFRVINSGGRISFPPGSTGHARQRGKLQSEGVVFRGDRIDLKRYGWPSHDKQLDELLWKPG